MKLKELRDKAGISQERLAQRAQVSLSTITRAEREGAVSLKTARKIAAALALTPEEMSSIWNGGGE